MGLNPINNAHDFKKNVSQRIDRLRRLIPDFNTLVSSLTENDQDLIIVGGFLRNVALGKHRFRDIDMLSTLDDSILLEKIKSTGLIFQTNRIGGIKLSMNNEFSIDIWSVINNWSFKNNRIKFDRTQEYSTETYLDKISSGCFFNIDSLTYSVSTGKCVLKHYNDCARTNQLDILRKNPQYKFSNPTKEANILRIYFLVEDYGLSLTNNTKGYLINELKNIGWLNDDIGALQAIEEKSKRYKNKYRRTVDSDELLKFIKKIKASIRTPFFD